MYGFGQSVGDREHFNYVTTVLYSVKMFNLSIICMHRNIVACVVHSVAIMYCAYVVNFSLGHSFTLHDNCFPEYLHTTVTREEQLVIVV